MIVLSMDYEKLYIQLSFLCTLEMITVDINGGGKD